MLPDPQWKDIEWRMNGFDLQFRHLLGENRVSRWKVLPPRAVQYHNKLPERVAVWRELFLRPCE